MLTQEIPNLILTLERPFAASSISHGFMGPDSQLAW